MTQDAKGPDAASIRNFAQATGLPLDTTRIAAVQPVLAAQFDAGLSLPIDQVQGVEPATVLTVEWE